jgi:hypothetical protein
MEQQKKLKALFTAEAQSSQRFNKLLFSVEWPENKQVSAFALTISSRSLSKRFTLHGHHAESQQFICFCPLSRNI